MAQRRTFHRGSTNGGYPNSWMVLNGTSIDTWMICGSPSLGKLHMVLSENVVCPKKYDITYDHFIGKMMLKQWMQRYHEVKLHGFTSNGPQAAAF